jgi:hypothetical protein
MQSLRNGFVTVSDKFIFRFQISAAATDKLFFNSLFFNNTAKLSGYFQNDTHHFYPANFSKM